MVSVGAPFTETILSVGWSLPTAWLPSSTASTSTPSGLATTWYPSLRSATAAATFCDIVISRRSALRCCASLTPAGTTKLAGMSVEPDRIHGKSFSSSVARRSKTSTK